MTRLHLACIVGARPNFMKMAPLLHALEAYSDVRTVLIHTGQHYDDSLSDVFFTDLGMPRPSICLEVGSGRHAAQTARVLERVEVALERGTPDGQSFDRVVVVGDVNSTMAAALAAVKLGIPVAHIEAGLRSCDRAMPEEINRIVTDAVSDLLFVSEPAGLENLRHEGRAEHEMHLVGNIMIDTLKRLLPNARDRDILREHRLQRGEYGVVTLHRPSNVDSPETLSGLIQVLIKASDDLRLVFPMHPRTEMRLRRFGLFTHLTSASGITTLPALGYLDFLALTSNARLVVTDSGGLQEEACALGIPCLTVRRNTERPITCSVGTSTLVGNDPCDVASTLQHVIKGQYKDGRCPKLWDGHAADRIARVLAE